jgi:hypothetical protein
MPYYLNSIIAFESESERSRILEMLSENGYNVEDESCFVEASMDGPSKNEPKSVPEEHLAQHYEILVKSARRCAYDLTHAADPTLHQHVDIEEMARNWQTIFSPDGVKNYRLDMHREIMSLQRQAKTLHELAEKAGLNPMPLMFR